MQKKLYGILDLEARRKENKDEAEPGMYIELEDKLRDSTFNKIINYMLDNATAEDNGIVDAARKFLALENGNTNRVQIACYKVAGLNDNGTLSLERAFDGDGSFAYLSDIVTPYIHPRGDDVDCLEMVLNLQTAGGSRKR